MTTPIVKVILKKTVIPFYTLTDYDTWKKSKQVILINIQLNIIRD